MDVTVFLVALMVFLATVLLVPAWLRHRCEMARLHLISSAMERGQTLDSVLLDELTRRWRPELGRWYAVICFVVALPSLGAAVGFLLSGSFSEAELDGQAAIGRIVGGCVNLLLGSGLSGLGMASLKMFTGRYRLRLSVANVLALLCLFVGVAAVSAGSGLAAAVAVIATSDVVSDEAAAAGMLLGVFMNIGPGIGLIGVGALILRLFRQPAEG